MCKTCILHRWSPTTPLELVIHVDSCKVGGRSFTPFICTLSNFGPKCLTIDYSFVLALAVGDVEHSVHTCQKLFGPLLKDLGGLIESGGFCFQGTFLPIKVVVGADEPFMRQLLGLAGCRYNWRSCYNYGHKRVPGYEKLPRLPSEFGRCPDPEWGFIHPPLVTVKNLDDFVICLLHLDLSLGRQLVSCLHYYADRNHLLKKVSKQLKRFKIFLPKFSKKKLGKISLNGRMAIRLMRNFEQLCHVALAPRRVLSCFREFKKILRFIHQDETVSLPWLKTKIESLRWEAVCNNFHKIICRGANPHYIFYLRDDVPRLLQYHCPHGLTYYSQAVCETYNCIIKNIFWAHSNRGGGKESSQHVLRSIYNNILLRMSNFWNPVSPGFQKRVHVYPGILSLVIYNVVVFVFVLYFYSVFVLHVCIVVGFLLYKP